MKYAEVDSLHISKIEGKTKRSACHFFPLSILKHNKECIKLACLSLEKANITWVAWY